MIRAMEKHVAFSGDRSELLCRVGRRLFGDRWQREFARGVGSNVRTVTRWVHGERSITDRTLEMLPDFIMEQADICEKAAVDLRFFACEIERELRG